MIASVMMYLLAVSAVIGVAAWVADEGLRRVGVPTRWLWLAALAAPPILVLAAWLLPQRVTAMVGGGAVAGPVIELPAFLLGNGTDPSGLGWPDALLAVWLASALAMVAVVVVAHVRLDLERRGWALEEVDGSNVLVSDDRGPAAAGLLRPWIVLPRWILDLPAAHRTLVILHEEEHVRGGDTLLLPLGLAFACAAPWNPIAWWQLGRMRAAMEVDCDRRVLRRRPEPATYGDSLLMVASRATGTGLAFAAFSEHRGSLHRRILAMTDVRTRWSSFRAVVLTLVACAIAVQACALEGPVAIDEHGIELVDRATGSIAIDPSSDAPTADIPSGTDPRRGLVTDSTYDPATVEPRSIAELRAAPTFTPFTVAPSITNRDEVIRAMTESYPPLLRDAGVGGTVRVYFFINDAGIVEQVRLDKSSGHQALDDAALNVAGAYRFSPALNREEKVPVWVSFPITFQVR
jgi:TonB family protein